MLNQRDSKYVYRLPTEAEWEYAARAGSTGEYAGVLDSMAWYDSNAGGTTQAVGQKQKNAWGLYDMHGNVWEWVQDWYDKTYYSGSPSTDPRGLVRARSGSFGVAVGTAPPITAVRRIASATRRATAATASVSAS
jgi:formylglycine-generating enzyme required for sulfatase activity